MLRVEVPSESVFGPPSPRYGPFLVLRLFDGADSGPFWALFGSFLGHIVGLDGFKGLFDIGKSSRTWSARTISLCLVVLTKFQGCFGQKWLFLANNGTDFRGHLATWRLRPRAPSVSWGLKFWIWEGHLSMWEMARANRARSDETK